MRPGEESDNRRPMVGMPNRCLHSHGLLEVHAIPSDGPNTSTLCADGLPHG